MTRNQLIEAVADGARKHAQQLGHTLGSWSRTETDLHAVCSACGAHVLILARDKRPIQSHGEALALACARLGRIPQ